MGITGGGGAGGEGEGGGGGGYTNSTATTTLVSCGFGGLQVNAWKVGTASVVKAMCGSVQVWP